MGGFFFFECVENGEASPLQFLKVAMVKWGQKCVEIPVALHYSQGKKLWKWRGSLYFIGKIVVIIDMVKIIKYV
jgi:hypothetical protein